MFILSLKGDTKIFERVTPLYTIWSQMSAPWRRLFLAAYTLWAKPGCCCCPA